MKLILKYIALSSLLLLMLNPIYAQDTLGQKFGFGMLVGKVYKYQMINQEITRNLQGAPLQIIQDTVIAEVEVLYQRDDGYAVQIKFNPIKEDGVLPDAIYSIPLKIVLDTNANTLAMINHVDYQALLYAQIDSMYQNGVYDSFNMTQMKLKYASAKSIESLIYKPFEDFFTIFNRQYQPVIKYAVGKEIYLPFDQEPFIAAGQTVVANIDRAKGKYYINTLIENTPEERVLLSAKYRDFLRRIGKFNPQIITPAIDVGYRTTHIVNTKIGVIENFMVENKLRVGEETKYTITKMTLLEIGNSLE